MTRVIWKWAVKGIDSIDDGLAWELGPMPQDAQIVEFGHDHEGDLCVWALLTEPGATPVDDGVVFRIFGTGWEIPDGFEHVRTAVIHSEARVWHLFRRAPV